MTPEVPSPDVSAKETVSPRSRLGRRLAARAAIAVVVALLGALAWFWQQSLLPGTYSVMTMGHPEYGGGPIPDSMSGMTDMTHANPIRRSAAMSVAELVGPERPADVSITLTARSGIIELTGQGEPDVSGYTLNHQSPGPRITVRSGEQLEVRLVNESVPDGITLHWHGVDVPHAQDGVAGVTQDAIAEGESFVYRFTVDEPGTYWYHSHQVSDEQVSRGLFGSLVVLPASDTEDFPPSQDAVAVVHTYSGHRTVNGVVGTDRVVTEPGSTARVRVVNTNDGPLRTWVTGSVYRVLAIDARDLNDPSTVQDQTIVIPAGGRADLLVPAPADGTAAAVNFGGGTRLAVGPSDGAVADGDDPGRDLDILSYGAPAPVAVDPASADRTFEYSIGRRLAFLDGRPGFWWTINGHLYPDVPVFVVEEGDIVVMTIYNHSGQVHPMHLHGHHALVVSRDGTAASGSPWWVDSLEVEDGETFVLAFVADNPGIWMDHCHNLPHASQGLVTHLMYAGVETPFVIGGEHENDPE